MSKRKKSGVGLIIFLAFIGYFAYTFITQQQMLESRAAEMSKVMAKIDEQKQKSQSLLKEKQELNTDEYIEKIAREKLGMVKEGEKIFMDLGR